MQAQALDPWTGARNSMRRFERGAVNISRTGVAGALSLAAAAALLTLLGVLLDFNLMRLRDTFAWTRHADAVMLQITGLQQSLFEAESGTRAFALTEDPAYLAALAAGSAEVAAHRKALYELVSGDPQQSARLDRLMPLVQGRLARFHWYVGLDREARRRQITSTAKPDIDMRARQRRISSDINKQLGAFRATDAALLQSRLNYWARSAAWLNLLAPALALLAPVLGGAGFYLLFRDRHRRRTQLMRSELLHSQRLVLMGETASMLAHEINQPLAAATNYVYVLNRLLDGEAEAAESLKDAVRRTSEQISRAVELLQRLRGFVARHETERASESPALMVSDAAALFETFGAAVRLETHVEAGLPELWIDRIEIQQVLVNLLRNALEALQDSERREIELSVMRDGQRQVRFCLRDSGAGLPPEVATRLFQPFVTTKPDGMGVGLSICRKIVLAHGGQIWAESAAGGGTQFCFTLPASQAPAIRVA